MCATSSMNGSEIPSPDQEENSVRQCRAGSLGTSHKQVKESVHKVFVPLRYVETGCYVSGLIDLLDVSIYKISNIGLFKCLSVLLDGFSKVGFNGLNEREIFHF